MTVDWTMPRRADACARCRREFAGGETFLTCLYDGQAGYERLDYCLQCPPADDRQAVGSWRSRRPEPTQKSAAAFDRQAISTLFEQLADDPSPERGRLRFVLALLLWRKRVLRFEESRSGPEGEDWAFVRVRDGVPFEVRRPEFDEAELQRLSEQLEGVLAGGTADGLPASSSDNGENRHEVG